MPPFAYLDPGAEDGLSLLQVAAGFAFLFLAAVIAIAVVFGRSARSGRG